MYILQLLNKGSRFKSKCLCLLSKRKETGGHVWKRTIKEDVWLPLNHRTVVCCFISYMKSSDERLFGLSNCAIFFFLHIAILRQSFWQNYKRDCELKATFFLTVNNESKRAVNTHTRKYFKNAPFSHPCLLPLLDTCLFVSIFTISWQSAMFETVKCQLMKLTFSKRTTAELPADVHPFKLIPSCK